MDEHKIRASAARDDIGIAKRRGSVIVCGTTRGNVELRRANGGFELRTLGISPALIASGSQREVQAALEPLYVVESA